MKWQLIDMAPKDEYILLVEPPVWGNGPGSVVVGYWCDGGFEEPMSGQKLRPTHWQPLPALPEVNQ